MAEEYKILGQSAPSATTDTDVYVVTAGKSAIISSYYIANRSTAKTTIRLSIVKSGDSGGLGKQVIVPDIEIDGNDYFSETTGITLGAGDKIVAYAGNGNLAINIFGTEI